MLKASVGAPNGGERILAILGPGSVVGELSMIDGAPCSASVTALRDAEGAVERNSSAPLRGNKPGSSRP